MLAVVPWAVFIAHKGMVPPCPHGGKTHNCGPACRPDIASRRGLCNYLHMNADKQECRLDVDSQYVELAVEVFSMLADATRVRIILALRDKELAVNDLAETVGKSPAAVSQHLAKLRMARIVTTRQVGTRVFYRLENEHARQLVADAIFQAEHTLGGIPYHHRAASGRAS